MITTKIPDNLENVIHVVGCFVEHDGKILFLKRNSKKYGGDTWGAPGGKVDKEDGTPENALVREVFEETGIVISKENLMQVGKYYVEHPENKKFIYTKYRVVLNEKPEISLREEEHQDFVWVTPSEAFNLKLILNEDDTIKNAYGLN
jgi:8-oxo-dGTP diphosphatase